MTIRSPSQVIGDEGENLFRTLIPSSFAENKLEKDYGLDFICQYFKDNINTGKFFAAQVKSEGDLRIKSDYISVRLETSHITDYIDRIHCMPICIAAIDVKEKKGYWVFIHEHMLEVVNSDSWRNQQTFTIRISKLNSFDDHQLFIDAFDNAYKYMQRFNIQSIVSMIQAKILLFKSLDQRFKVDISSDGNSENYNLSALENIPISFTAQTPEASERFLNMMESGQPLIFHNRDLKIEGSLLIDHILENMGNAVQLQMAHTSTLMLKLSVKGKNEVKSLVPFKIAVVSGTAFAVMEGALEESPINFSATIDLKDPSHTTSVDKFFFYESWLGKSVLHLPYFEMMHDLFINMNDGLVECEFSRQGIVLLRGHLKIRSEIFYAIRQKLEFIMKLRFLCEKFGLNELLIDNIKRDDILAIMGLHEMITAGSYSLEISHFRLTNNFDLENAIKFLEAFGNDKWKSFSIAYTDDKWRFLNSEVSIPHVLRTLDRVTIANKKSMETQIKQSKKQIECIVIGAKRTSMKIELKERPSDN